MTPLASIEAAARALAPADLQLFRAWLTAYADAAAPPMRVDALGPYDDCRPEDYADFSEQAYDALTEELEAAAHERTMRDLRWFESLDDRLEAEALDASKKAERDTLDALFLANDPEPPDDADPVDRAEWDWRKLEDFFARGAGPALVKHRLQHGAFVERKAAGYREHDEHMARIRDMPRTPLPPRSEKKTTPWPPADGSDPIGPWLMFEYMDPEDLDETVRQREFPDYKLADDLEAAIMGWRDSFCRDEWEFINLFSHHTGAFHSAVSSHRHDGVRPFSIGRDILRLRRGLEHVPLAREILDALRDMPWVTPPAYACLRVLLDEAAEAVEARLAEVEAIHDGLRDLAHQRYGTHNCGFGRGYATSDSDEDD